MAFGFLMSGFSVGNLIGFVAACVLPRPGTRTLKVLLIGVLLAFGAVIIALGFISVTALDFALLALLGLGNGYVAILMYTWMQTRTPERMLGRVMSFLMFANSGLVPLSQALSGALGKWDLTGMLVIAGTPRHFRYLLGRDPARTHRLQRQPLPGRRDRGERSLIMLRPIPLSRDLLKSPWTFVIAVFAWTWTFWLIAILAGLGTGEPEGMLLALGGLLGPMFGGIAFSQMTGDRAARRDYWTRLVDVRRIPAHWYLVILMLTPVLMLVAAGIDLAFGGDLAAYQERFADFFATPELIPLTLAMVLLVGPLPEEFGWHGYLLDRLQVRHGAVMSGVLLGVIWGAWHLPLFFLNGTYQQEQGAFTIWFWTFMIGIIPLEVVMAWIYNCTRRSTFGIILFHFMVVVSCNFLNATPGANIVSTLLWIGVALVVTLLWTAPRRPIEELDIQDLAPAPR